MLTALFGVLFPKDFELDLLPFSNRLLQVVTSAPIGTVTKPNFFPVAVQTLFFADGCTG